MRFVFILSCLLFIYAPPAFADLSEFKKNITPRELDSWRQQLPRYTDDYNKALKALYLNNDPRKVEEKVRSLRSYYPRTEQYSPFSKEILDKITSHALILDSAIDNEVINDALSSYNALVGSHLMNFDVANFALTMARIDPRFGDDGFYEKVRNSLIKVFYVEGRGRKAEFAYEIISYGEETYILDQIGGKIENSEIYNVGRRYYNVHEIIDEDGNYRQVFMDVTQPIKNTFYYQIIKE